MDYEQCEKVIAENIRRGKKQLWFKEGSESYLKIVSNGLCAHLEKYYRRGVTENPYLIGWRLNKKKP